MVVVAAALAGRQLELVAVQAQSHSRVSMTCDRYRWLNASQRVCMTLQSYEVVCSEVCAFLDKLGT